MFFALSKIAWFFLAPSNVLLVAIATGLALVSFTRFRKTGLGLAWTGAVLVAVLGFSPAASLMMNGLETRFPPYADDGADVTGIVVLGGSIAQDASMELGQPVVNESADRLIAAATLAKRHPDARLVLSGGSARLIGADRHTEAEAMAALMIDLGIPAERLVIEDRSQNTWQNAVYSREIAEPRDGERWLLVTSAWHMPRSMGVFRQAGFPVVPYPTDFRTVGGDEAIRPFRSVAEGLQRLDITVREIVGLVAYRVTGRTDAVFPGP